MESLEGKKILFVITKSNWGGAQVYVHTLATQARDRGAEVVVALGGTGAEDADVGLLADRLEHDRIRTVRVSAFMRNISLTKELAALKELRQIIRNERPDILHLNSSKAGGVGALAGRLEHVPHIIFTAHGWAHREPRPFPVRVLIWLLSYLTIALSTSVIVVSQYDYRSTPSFFSRKKVVTIHNGISPTQTLDARIARERIHAMVPAARSFSRLILAVAELHPNKGIDIAVRAFANVPDSLDAAFIVLGEGEDRTSLEALIAAHGQGHRFFLPGFAPNAGQYLPAADIVCIPSRKEGLPFALLEAGIASAPVIAAATGGIPEIIDDGVQGLLITPGDEAALAQALTRFLTEPEFAQSCGATLGERVRTEFSEAAMLEATFALYA